jgi:hypothetical protein
MIFLNYRENISYLEQNQAYLEQFLDFPAQTDENIALSSCGING